jgi:transcriptional regulator with XRE-family HTH domain
MTFGEKLLFLRQRAHMSQDALAEKLNVSRQAVSKWERDETMPETENVIRIAQIFTVSTDYLLLPDSAPAQPQAATQSTSHSQAYNSDRIERFIRRHGYKAGYFLMAGGAILCIIALLVMLLLPNFGIFENRFGGGIAIDGGSIDKEIMEELLWDSISGGFGDITGRIWRRNVTIMAILFGSPLLLAGIALLVLGGLIVTKGKKLATKAM